VPDAREPGDRVTVVVPFIGDVAWLEEAVRSALAQTLAPVEVIVVTDAPLERTAHLEARDERIRIIEGAGTGPAAARNRGVQAARGELIAFLDADDLFLPTKLELQLSAMDEQGLGFSHTSYERMADDGTPIDIIPSGRQTGKVYPAILLHCVVATPTVVVRRDLLGPEPFRESLRVADDTLLWIALARRTPFLGIDRPLTRVRMHGDNAGDDLNAQVLAWKSILRIALPADPDLPREFRRQTKIVIHRTLASLERRRGNQLASALARARAMALSAREVYRSRGGLRLAARRTSSIARVRYMRIKIRGSRLKRRILARSRRD